MNNSDRIYWAKEHPDELINSLEDRWKKYQSYLKSSLYWQRVLRNIAYFHGQFFNESSVALDSEIKLIGNEAEYIGFGANHFRNLLEHIFQMAARDRIAMKARAINSDNDALHQARMGTALWDYYQVEKFVEDKQRMAAWHSLLFAQGFTMHLWDPTINERIDAGPMAEQEVPNILEANDTLLGEEAYQVASVTQYEGDLRYTNPTVNDMAWDFSRPWDSAQWIIVREMANKWDLVQRYPDKEEDILGANDKESEFNKVSIYKDSVDIVEEDLVPVYRFFHEKTEAVETGRYTYYVPGAWLEDVELPYRRKPLSRITPGEWIGQGTGWTPAFNLQAPQEMLNGELSAIASNHAAFGTQDMWVPTGQEKLKVTRHKGGLRIISSGVKPESLSLLDTKPEMFKFVQDLITNMQLIVGVTGATRGIPEKGVTAGNALALLDAQSIQFNSSFVYSFNRFNEDVATFSIRTLQDFADTERVITILGKANMPYQYKFKGEDLKKIDRFVVESVNPLTKTLAGRDAKAKDLIQIGAIRTPEQYNQVFESGNLEPMFEAAMAQLSIIRDENEALLNKTPVHVAEIDNHVLHIKEHAAIFGTINNRQDPEIASYGLPHIMEHITKLMDPNIQLLQMTLGYQVPPGFLMGGGMVTPMPNQEAGETEPQPPESRGHKPEIKMPKPAKPPKRLGKEETEEEVA